MAGFGILVGVAYTLRALQQAFFDGPGAAGHGCRTAGDAPSMLAPISVPERLGAVMLIGTSLLIGLYPRLLLDLIVAELWLAAV